jgi:hypothetical protein
MIGFNLILCTKCTKATITLLMPSTIETLLILSHPILVETKDT